MAAERGDSRSRAAESTTRARARAATSSKPSPFCSRASSRRTAGRKRRSICSRRCRRRRRTPCSATRPPCAAKRCFSSAGPPKPCAHSSTAKFGSTDSASILANQRMIWDGFRQTRRCDAALAPTGDRVVDGWLALAPLATSGSADLRRSLLAWRETYTTTPPQAGCSRSCWPRSARRLSRADRAAAAAHFAAAHSRPRDSRRLHRRASAQHAQRRHQRSRLRHRSGSARRDAYLHAQLDGADFIVGPLLASRSRASHHSGRLRADARAEFRDRTTRRSCAASISSRWRPRTRRA